MGQNFQNRNWPIPAGNSIPELDFGFFDVKTLSYVINSQCGHVPVAPHNYLV